MSLSKAVITAVLMSSVFGAPAWAQHRQGAESRGQAAPRSAPAARPAAQAPRTVTVAPSVAPRAVAVPRAQVAPRVYNSPRVYAQSGAVVGRAVPRAYYPSYAHGYYGYARPVYVAPVHFYRPYYAFHPHLSVGFGLWLGYPIPYAYSYYVPPYYAPYGYPYPAYGYPYSAYPQAYPPAGYPPAAPPQGSYPPAAQGSVVPQTNMGGLSFEIEPSSAEVIVDGNYVGTVGQFTPSSQPLGLTAGRHHVEIRASGYRTIVLDVDIAAGQVLPYRGAMER